MAPKLMMDMAEWMRLGEEEAEVQKKPAAAGAPTNSAPKKRPAAAGTSGTSAPKKRPAAADDDTTRDRGKSRMFALRFDSLPQHVQTQYNEAAKGPRSRIETTRIINEAMDKMPDGSYEVNCEKPIFQEFKMKYDERYGVDRKRAMTYTFAAAAAGGEDQLKKAVASGEVIVSLSGGIKFYTWREMECGRKSGSMDTSQVSASRSLSATEYATISDHLKSLRWDFASAPETVDKPISELPGPAVETMAKAIGSSQRLLGEVEKVLGLLAASSASSASEHARELRDRLAPFSDSIAKLTKIKLMSTNTDGTPLTLMALKKILSDHAKVCEPCFEKVELSKAFLKMH